jgi:hypothetical protein
LRDLLVSDGACGNAEETQSPQQRHGTLWDGGFSPRKRTVHGLHRPVCDVTTKPFDLTWATSAGRFLVATCPSATNTEKMPRPTRGALLLPLPHNRTPRASPQCHATLAAHRTTPCPSTGDRCRAGSSGGRMRVRTATHRSRHASHPPAAARPAREKPPSIRFSGRCMSAAHLPHEESREADYVCLHGDCLRL